MDNTNTLQKMDDQTLRTMGGRAPIEQQVITMDEFAKYLSEKEDDSGLGVPAFSILGAWESLIPNLTKLGVILPVDIFGFAPVAVEWHVLPNRVLTFSSSASRQDSRRVRLPWASVMFDVLEEWFTSRLAYTALPGTFWQGNSIDSIFASSADKIADELVRQLKNCCIKYASSLSKTECNASDPQLLLSVILNIGADICQLWRLSGFKDSYVVVCPQTHASWLPATLRIRIPSISHLPEVKSLLTSSISSSSPVHARWTQ